jgi:uncharacterized protein (DUF1800 family)
MSLKRPGFAVAFILLAVGLVAPAAPAKKKDKPSPPSTMDEQKRALQALNRLTFGPRPGDVQRVMAIGVDKWIDEQLHPEKISDIATESRLAPLRTLRMDTREIVESFPPPQIIKEVEQGRRPMPSDPVKRAIYEDQIERIQEKQALKETAAALPDKSNSDTASGEKVSNNDKLEDDAMARRREDRQDANLKADQLLELPPDQRMREILKMSPEERHSLANSIKGPKREEFFDGMNAQQRETLMALNNPQQVVVDELVAGKLLRATYAERQLLEVMTDFWINHFNVFIGKDADRFLLTSYERDVIRPHAMGKFEDLLVATAHSPAMMFYLDNWLSVGPDSNAALGIPKNGGPWRHPRAAPSAQRAKGNRNGLNENYGRELMELHTLGVNGGYTQKDVTEVAKVFTGWTLKQPRQGGGFSFEENMHEPGYKIVLGQRIKPNGEREGLEVLHILAHQPSTAKFISTKLAMRFVSDDPPPALVNRMAQTFLKKNGDIREVLKTMLGSPEFWSNDAYRAKVKTPLEFVVSSLRASDADVTDALPITRQLQNLGMPLYGMQPPTGYSMKADAWVNSSALLGRMNFALTLAAGKMKGTQVNWDWILGSASPTDSHQSLATLEEILLAGDVSKQTHDTITAKLDDPNVTQRRLDDPARAPDIAVISGLILGSPEFQRR